MDDHTYGRKMSRIDIAAEHGKQISRKGSLSLEMVVIAVVCLLVLVVLTVIFMGKMQGWNEGMKYCDTVCVKTAQECTELGYGLPAFWSNCEDNSGNKFGNNAYCCKEKK